MDSEVKGKQEPPRPLVFGLWAKDMALGFLAASFLTLNLQLRATPDNTLRGCCAC